MSALTDRLRYVTEHLGVGDATMAPPPRGSMKWTAIQCAEAADRIDFLEPELERFKRLLDDEHAKHMAALIRLHAIDHVHVVTPCYVRGVLTDVCLFDDEEWPCWHHRQIHPDDPVVQQYVEKVRQEMEDLP